MSFPIKSGFSNVLSSKVFTFLTLPCWSFLDNCFASEQPWKTRSFVHSNASLLMCCDTCHHPITLSMKLLATKTNSCKDVIYKNLGSRCMCTRISHVTRWIRNLLQKIGICTKILKTLLVCIHGEDCITFRFVDLNGRDWM